MSDDKIAVAMSGGVDSSVAAAILKNKGYDVTGLTVKFYTEGENFSFPYSEDIHSAEKICEILQIPHMVLDLEEFFRKKVIDYFISDYLSGRTPNPCVICNQHIKFGILLDEAERIGCSYLATGHYAIIFREKKRNTVQLCRGKEHGKDQSYFLARISKQKLRKVLFPVGTYPKSKIRKLAERFDLPVSSKKESQEVCFINDEKIFEFIERYKNIKLDKGAIRNKTGEHIGTHNGIAGYTIGQRKGVGVAVGKPVFVNKIEKKSNEIFVGEGKDLYKKTFRGTDFMCFLDNIPENSLKVNTRIRYAHRPAASEIIIKEDDIVEVTFKKPQRAITPGQLAVFYKKDTVVGSAWIRDVEE